MESFQERVLNEKKELDTKIEKLGEFVKTEFFQTLPEIDSQLLNLQLGTMKIYSQILDVRMERFGK